MTTFTMLNVDYVQAFGLYLTAATMGNTCAKNDLGARYARGHGVALDDQNALLWFSRAARSHILESEGKLDSHPMPVATEDLYAAAYAQFQLAKVKQTTLAENQFSPQAMTFAKELSDYLQHDCIDPLP